jgi:hypothetical protein
MASPILSYHPKINADHFKTVKDFQRGRTEGPDGREIEYEVPNVIISSIPKSSYQQVVDYFRSSEAVFRVFQLAERTLKIVGEVVRDTDKATANYCEKTAPKFGMAANMTSILRLPEVTGNALDAINDKDRSIGFSAYPIRKMAKKVKDVAEAAAMWGYSLALVTGKMAYKTIADYPDFVSNFANAGIALHDWKLSKKCADEVEAVRGPAGLRNLYVDTQRAKLIEVAKAVCSMASFILGLGVTVSLLTAAGVATVPALVTIGIGLTGTLLGCFAKYYSVSSPYEFVDFFKERSLFDAATNVGLHTA